jgi:hypothetical protein
MIERFRSKTSFPIGSSPAPYTAGKNRSSLKPPQLIQKDLPMANIYDDDRIFFPEDPELRVLGSTEKLSQWRHRNTGPAFIRIGRRIGYHGTDLNAYLHAQRVDPNSKAA